MTEIIDEGAQGSAQNKGDVEMQEKGMRGVFRQAEDAFVQTGSCQKAKAPTKSGTLQDTKATTKPVVPLNTKATTKLVASLDGEVAARRAVCPGEPVSLRDPRPRVVRGVWAGCGFLAFGLGALGAVIPLLPTIPFLMVAAFCFARSSERLDVWFRSTSLYRKVLEGYVARRAMTLRSKLLLLVPVTLLLGISFALMANVPAGRVAVVVIWMAHLVYFGFVVKTARGCEGSRADAGSVAPRRPVTDVESGR